MTDKNRMPLQEESQTSVSSENSTNVYHVPVTLNHTMGLLLVSKETIQSFTLEWGGTPPTREKHHPINVELENRTTEQNLSPMLTFFPEDTAGTKKRNTRNYRVKFTSEVATPFPTFLLLQHTLYFSVKYTFDKVDDYT